MFVVVTYDVNQKRDAKVLKICRRYLAHVQKSVCEGYITEAKLNRLKRELKNVINVDEDTLCIYALATTSGLVKEQIGVNLNCSSII